MKVQGGYTLVELLYSMAIMAVLLLAVGTFVTDNSQNIYQADTKIQLEDNTRTAVENMATVVRSAKSVEANNAQPDANSPGAPGNLYSWSASSGSSATLIVAIPARNSSGNLIYSDGLHNNLYTNDYVYYLDSST